MKGSAYDMVSGASGEKKRPQSRLLGSKKGRMAVIMLGAMLGVALLVFGGMGERDGSSDHLSQSESFSEYAESVEKKIYELCSRVEGVSNVSVAVSFECGFEYVYAREEGGGEYLVVGSGSTESAVRVTEKTPTIGGVGIVCRGGGDPTVQNRLIRLISAAFGVSSNKIYITEAAK